MYIQGVLARDAFVRTNRLDFAVKSSITWRTVVNDIVQSGSRTSGVC